MIVKNNGDKEPEDNNRIHYWTDKETPILESSIE